MTNSIVALRAYRDGLHLIIKPHLSITEIEEAIQDEISRMDRPLTGTSVQIDIKGPILQAEEMARLRSKLKESYNLTVRGIVVSEEPVSPADCGGTHDAYNIASSGTITNPRK